MSQPSVKANYLYNISYQILTLLTPFITTPYISRVLGADGVGIYSYTSSIIAYFSIFAVLGTAEYGTREVARLRNDKVAVSKAFWEIQVIVFTASAICLLGWLILSFSSIQYKYYLLALTPTLIATSLNISWFFIGLEKVGYTVLRNAICKIIGVVCLFLFVKDKGDLGIYIWINSIILLLGNLSMWTYIPKLVDRIPLKKLLFRKHLRETLTYFVITISISLYTVLDKILIGYITNDNSQNGYYEQANKIITLIKNMSFVALNGIMSARLSFLFAQNKKDEIKIRIKRSIDFNFLLVFFFIFVICSVANNFVPIFFGSGYNPVVSILCLMTPLLFFISISTTLGSHYYIPSNQIKKCTYITVVGSILNLFVNILLIPKFAAIGAVIGSIIGEGFIAVVYVIKAKAVIDYKLIFKLSYKRFLAGVLMLVIAHLISKISYLQPFTILMAQIAGSAFVYFISLWLMKDDMIAELVNLFFQKIGLNKN